MHSRAEVAAPQILHFTAVFLPFYLFVSSCYLIRLTLAHVLIGAQLSTENVVSVWRGGSHSLRAEASIFNVTTSVSIVLDHYITGGTN